MKGNIKKYLIFVLLILFMPIMVCNAYDLEIIPINYVNGDSTLLKSGGEYLLIDAGSGSKGNMGTVVLNALKNNGITANTTISLYLSHYDSDHYGGLYNTYYVEFEGVEESVEKFIENPDDDVENWTSDGKISIDVGLFGKIIKSYNVQKVYLPAKFTDSELNASTTANAKNKRRLINYKHDAIKQFAEENGVTVISLNKGSTFSFGNTNAEVLFLDRDTNYTSEGLINNNPSLVTMFTNGNVKFLTAGDIESSSRQGSSYKYAEEQILASGIDVSADIFKLSHHAGNSANSDAFLKKVNPKYVYAQVRYTHINKGYYSVNAPFEYLRTLKGANIYSNIDLIKFKEITDSIGYATESQDDQIHEEAKKYATPNIRFIIEDNTITPIYDNVNDNKYMYRLAIMYKDQNTDEVMKVKTYDFSSSETYYLYDYKDKTFAGYTYSKGENEIPQSGKLTENKTYNIYYTSNKRKITINYFDEENNKLLGTEDFIFQKGDPYALTNYKKEFNGYTVSKGEDEIPSTGTMGENKTYNVYYKPKTYKLTIKHVDENGKTLIDDEIKSYKYNRDYETASNSEVLKKYDLVEEPENAKGTILGDTVVTYKYKEKKALIVEVPDTLKKMAFPFLAALIVFSGAAILVYFRYFKNKENK